VICTAGPVAAITQPVGPAHYQEGRVTLADGTTFSIQGDARDADFRKGLHKGDRIEICFGPSRRWADQPLNARAAWAVRVKDGESFTTIGEPGKNARILR
jgi:hypothetical protein